MKQPEWVKPLFDVCMRELNGGEVSCSVLRLRCPVRAVIDDEVGKRVRSEWNHVVGPLLAQYGFVYTGTDFKRGAVGAKLTADQIAMFSQRAKLAKERP
jgi:hypothetical protein